jgi:hypothetical protein
MSSVLKYQIEHEVELLALLGDEPDWNSFLSEDAIETFKEALLESETYLCECEGKICGYIRPLSMDSESTSVSCISLHSAGEIPLGPFF